MPKKNNCAFCDGSGYVPCDEFDPDSGQYMNGVGETKCICTIEEEIFDERL